MCRKLATVCAAVVALSAACPEATARQFPNRGAPHSTRELRRTLIRGDRVATERELNDILQRHPGDDNALFMLGAFQFLDGVETFNQFLYATGARQTIGIGSSWVPGRFDVPFLACPLGASPGPRPVRYEDWRAALDTLRAAMADAGATLERIDGPVRVQLNLARVKLDLDGDGHSAVAERPVALLFGPNRMSVDGVTRLPPGKGELPSSLPVLFDRADAEWLASLCKIYEGAADLVLAYDMEEFWDHAAPLAFPRPVVGGPQFENVGWSLAALHHARFPAPDANRTRSARRSFLAAVRHQRAMFKEIAAETDNRLEWIPGPDQDSQLQFELTQQQIDAWVAFLDEAERALEGKRLIPFHRPLLLGVPADRQGVNLKKALEQPTAFDLIAWIQGPGAEPFLEAGDPVASEIWNTLRTPVRSAAGK